MSLTETGPSGLEQVRRRLLVSLAINGLLPLAAYALLRLAGVSDLAALLVSAAIPAARTLALWAWRRRVDWLGVQALVGLGVAALGTLLLGGNPLLLGGNPLLLEVHSFLLTGVAGVVLLFSAAIGKPLLLTLTQALLANKPELASRLADRPGRQRAMTLATLFVGLALLADAVAHVVLALTIPVDMFASLSRVTNWLFIGSAVAVLWWLRRLGQRMDRV
jgi:hypothetical protein